MNLNEEEQSRKEIFTELVKEIGTSFVNFIKSRNAKALFLKQLKQLNYERELEQGKEKNYQTGDLWAMCKPFVLKYGLLLISLFILKVFPLISFGIWAFYYLKPIFQWKFKVGDYKGIVKYYKKKGIEMTSKELYCDTPMVLIKRDELLNRYLNENVSGTRNAKVLYTLNIEEHELYGTVRVLAISDDFKRNEATSLTDFGLTHAFIIPQKLAKDGEIFQKSYYSNKKIIRQSLDDLLFDDFDNLVEKLKKDTEIHQSFKEFKEILEKKEQDLENLKSQQQKDILKAERENLKRKFLKNYSEKATKALMFLYKDTTKEELASYPNDFFKTGIESTDDYLKIRMTLNQGESIKKVKSKLDFIAAGTGIFPKILENTSNQSNYELFFKLNNSLKSREMSFEEVKEEGEKGIFTLGKGYLGDYTVKIPTQDEPFFTLVGGLSRSGKSTVATRLLVNTMFMENNDGGKTYSDYFISSVKDEDYIANGFKNKGMLIVNNPLDTLSMLKEIDRIGYRRKALFLENNVINIKQFNNKFPNDQMGKVMVVMDEYANLLRAAGSQVIEEDGKKIKLKEKIEQLITKINAEHGSRGVNSVIITQNFLKSEVGAVRDTIECNILGFAQENVWATYDNSGEIGKMLKNKDEERQGVFLINSGAFKPLESVKYEATNGFVETKTHFIDTETIKEGLENETDLTYETAEKYSYILGNSETEVLEDLEEL